MIIRRDLSIVCDQCYNDGLVEGDPATWKDKDCFDPESKCESCEIPYDEEEGVEDEYDDGFSEGLPEWNKYNELG
jgi:hypothetical protein